MSVGKKIPTVLSLPLAFNESSPKKGVTPPFRNTIEHTPRNPIIPLLSSVDFLPNLDYFHPRIPIKPPTAQSIRSFRLSDSGLQAKTCCLDERRVWLDPAKGAIN